MTQSPNELAERIDTIPATERIEKRLRRQHARWWLQQPASKSRRHRIVRRVCRIRRRLTCKLEQSPLGLTLVVIVLLAFFGWLGFMLVRNVVESSFDAELTDLEMRHAITCWSFYATSAVLILSSTAPGSNRSANLTHSSKTTSFIRHTRIKPQPISRQGIWIGFVSVMGFVLACILKCGQALWLPPVLGIVFAWCTGWCAWQVNLRLRAYSARTIIHDGTLWDYVAAFVFISTLISTLFLVSFGTPNFARFCQALGPIGWVASSMPDIQLLQPWTMTRLLTFAVSALVVGLLARPNIHSWSYRRSWIEAQRLRLPDGDVAAKDNSAMSSDGKVHSAEEIAHAVRRSLNTRTASFFSLSGFIPPELHNRWGFYVVAIVCLAGYQLVVSALMQLNMQPGSATVFLNGQPQHELYRLHLCLSAAFAFSVTELIALSTVVGRINQFASRPINFVSFWWDVQKQALPRTRLQIGLGLTFAISAVCLGSDWQTAIAMLCAGLILLPIIRTVVAFNCGVRAIRPFCGQLAGYFVDLIPFLSGMSVFILCFVFPVAIVLRLA